MAEFAIGHLRNTLSVNLSGGERRRLEIARALAARPTFLLLDEPLAGIDPIALNEIRDLISQLQGHGLGVLITDHNVRETLDVVDRTYIIHDGAVLMEGTPSEVVQHRGVREVYLGDRSQFKVRLRCGCVAPQAAIEFCAETNDIRSIRERSW